MEKTTPSDSNTPIISVIIPTFNGSHYLRKAILSAMPESQGVKDLEIIVVDDKSNDNSYEIAKSFPSPVRAFKLKNNGGVANARNFGISKSRGQYIALLDQDDMFLPNKLKTQLAVMHSDPSLVLCHGNISVINDIDEIIPHDTLGHRNPPPSGEVTSSLFQWNHVIACTAFFCKDAYLKVGEFNTKTWGTDDYEMWLNLSLQGKFKYINEVISQYRWHDSNASKRAALMVFNRMSARTEFLKRHPRESTKIQTKIIAQVLYQHAKDFSYNLTTMREYVLARKTISIAMQFVSKRHKLSLGKIYIKTFIHQILK